MKRWMGTVIERERDAWQAGPTADKQMRKDMKRGMPSPDV